MLIKALTKEDLPAWLALAHESDDIVARMIPDLVVFYADFNEYMARKIEQQEAFMAVDVLTNKCLGIIAFSKNHNRITFLGVTRTASFSTISTKLMEYALKQLDNTREITINILKSNAGIFKQERALYERLGFIKSNDTIMENGIPACVMKKNPGEKVYTLQGNREKLSLDDRINYGQNTGRKNIN
jgi:predicted GNAT family N-acyltransferase